MTKVIKWTESTDEMFDAGWDDGNVGPPMGGFFNFHDENHTWKYYKKSVWMNFRSRKFNKKGAEYAEALRDAIVSSGIKNGGHWHQNGEGVPFFDDGKFCLTTMRAWGDLMAAIWSDHDKKMYSYCDFAWRE